MKRNIYFPIILVAVIFSATVAQAQEATKRERVVFEPGTIVSSQTGRVADSRQRASSTPYDANIIGVATTEENKLSVYDVLQTDGISLVRYNDENGSIKKGDFITASSKAGESMKATGDGIVLGAALEDANPSNKFLKVRILIQYYNKK